MPQLLPDQLPWWVVGPGLGLLVVGLYAIANKPLGASGAYLQTWSLLRRGRADEPWRAAYFGGLLAGAVVAVVLRGGAPLGFDYGALGDALPTGALLAVLCASGLLMGYGARWMGGCTSGHGLCGVSALAAGSIVATATFFPAAVATAWLLHLLSGGTV